jgi:CheY-like chemotaxis protein
MDESVVPRSLHYKVLLKYHGPTTNKDSMTIDLPTVRLVSAIRKRTGLTQEGLARDLGVSFATLNAWERGRSEPRTSHRRALEQMASDLGIDGGLRILIVDDDPAATTVLEGIVLGLPRDVTVWTESNGTDGLLRCGTVRPDVLFLDIRMPGVDGFAVAERLNHIEGLEDVRIIFNTSLTDEGILQRARDSSAVAVINKPNTPGAVEEALQQALASADPQR